MGMTGWNIWREKEAKKKSNNATSEEVEKPKEEVTVETAEAPVAPKKGKKPIEK